MFTLTVPLYVGDIIGIWDSEALLAQGNSFIAKI